jgi:hypothetical protein
VCVCVCVCTYIYICISSVEEIILNDDLEVCERKRFYSSLLSGGIEENHEMPQ